MNNSPKQEREAKENQDKTFGNLGISPRLLEVLDHIGFITPTPIQYRAIPTAIEGKDIIGIAQTGTGKTLAFGIPIIQRILKSKTEAGLIVLPTRELAIQVDETLMKIGRTLNIKTAQLIGGSPISNQIRMIRNNPDIIIGTPGRINDHLQQKTLKLDKANILVLDEADRMLDMGFLPQINKILQHLPQERQTMLFSATMPDEISKIASKHMRLPVRVEIVKPGTTSENVEHELFIAPKSQKLELLKKILSEYKGSALVFVRAKFAIKKICLSLKDNGISATEMHSNKTLNQRREALEGFKVGKYRVLVATDIASRGIDVKGIELVVNYDLPENAEDYVHRIGRTGRAGMKGKAISFVLPDQGSKVREIEKLARIYLPISKLPEDLPKSTFEPEFQERRNSFRRNSNSNNKWRNNRPGYNKRK